MERVLPKTVDYSDVLPLAVESRARRRTFFPVNGQEFVSNGANIIRFDLSADALLDTQHSYLRFTLTLDGGAATAGMDFSGGHGVIKRLRVSQSGTVLEDINSYNRLMGAIVLPCQSGNDHSAERSITELIRVAGGGSTTTAAQTQNASYIAGALNDITPIAASAAAAGAIAVDGSGDPPTRTEMETTMNTIRGVVDAAIDTAVDAVSADIRTKVNGMTTARQLAATFDGKTHNLDTQMINGTGYTICIPLNSGILNCDKLVPLMLMSAPLSIEIELAPTNEPFCYSAAGTHFKLSNCRYIANLIEVGGDVAQQLRMVQEMSGGVLTLAGQTYTHFNADVKNGAQGDQIVNKSMKSLFFASQSNGGTNQSDKYTVSYGGNMLLKNYQLKIGSVVYPPTPIQCNFADDNGGALKGEALMELAKAWGNVGSTKGIGQLNQNTLYVNEDDAKNKDFILLIPLI